MSPLFLLSGGLVVSAVLLLALAAYLMKRQESAKATKAPSDATAVLPVPAAPIPRAARKALPVAPIEGDDPEEVTLETLTVGSVIPRLREIATHGKKGRVFNLVSDVTIGRARDNDIVINEEAASAHHCRLERHGVTFRLIDLGSTNHSWVNGEKKQHVVLRNSDAVKIGDTEFVYDLFGDRG